MLSFKASMASSTDKFLFRRYCLWKDLTTASRNSQTLHNLWLGLSRGIAFSLLLRCRYWHNLLKLSLGMTFLRRNAKGLIFRPEQISIGKLVIPEEHVETKERIHFFVVCIMPRVIHCLAYWLVSSTTMSTSSSVAKRCKIFLAVSCSATLLTAPDLEVNGVTFTSAGSWLYPILPSSSSSKNSNLGKSSVLTRNRNVAFIISFSYVFNVWFTSIWMWTVRH